MHTSVHEYKKKIVPSSSLNTTSKVPFISIIFETDISTVDISETLQLTPKQYAHA